jgi:hypothetical protein
MGTEDERTWIIHNWLQLSVSSKLKLVIKSSYLVSDAAQCPHITERAGGWIGYEYQLGSQVSFCPGVSTRRCHSARAFLQKDFDQAKVAEFGGSFIVNQDVFLAIALACKAKPWIY